MRDYNYGYPPRFSVAEQKKRAEKTARKLTAKGNVLEPAAAKGTKIASTFWGQSWNRNLESYQHYENRLPRGRSYLKHGAVIDLKVQKGMVTALVSGSELYEVSVQIKPLNPTRWKALKKECSGQITSLIGLLQGKLPAAVMQAVTSQDTGLFPEPRDIKFVCSCPDYADLCKHASAALYGVGARFDEKPELLFLLRGVDHTELIDEASTAVVTQSGVSDADNDLGDLSAIFGIELEEVVEAPPVKTVAKKTTKKTAKKMAKKTAKKR